MKKAKNKNKSRDFFQGKIVKHILQDPKRCGNVQKKALVFQIAAELDRIRRTNGITQKQLAERVKISQQELSRIERGKRNITLGTLLKISNGFDLVPVIKFVKNRECHY